MAIKQRDPTVQITIFHDRPFQSILSRGIAGLFRISQPTPILRLYGNETFVHLAELWRTLGGFSGVQLLSGHIMSEDENLLRDQERAYGDIVYNFRFLSEEEKKSQFSSSHLDESSVIHYTAFTSEGAKYCPWMKKELIEKGVDFVQRKIDNLDELADEGFEIVVNCAGLDGGRLAGIPDDTFPIRGILLKVDAPWQKHFLFRNFTTFTIPTIDAVYVGTVKEDYEDSMTITKNETNKLWCRYLSLQPTFKNVKVLDHFVGLRPGRSSVRVEAETRTTENGTKYKFLRALLGNVWSCVVHEEKNFFSFWVATSQDSGTFSSWLQKKSESTIDPVGTSSQKTEPVMSHQEESSSFLSCCLSFDCGSGSSSKSTQCLRRTALS
ncbi:hypothetical protein Y032_0007g3486 [Ancylostoma ceylanicum]|uniref:FAD dependent oxidoreductase domain-containing protein n=1 Tax=Ancylostoma ceylanicum TaxID=53326 RepID=A0A016VNA0_9BILA|nr:hypothetical protein Y032_0007g3486 [Ancylostoma ceylanicum]